MMDKIDGTPEKKDREYVTLELEGKTKENFEVIRKLSRQDLKKNTDVVRFAVAQVAEELEAIKA